MNRLFLLCVICTAAQLTSAATYLTADRYLDVEKGRYVENPVIVIDEGRIISVTGNTDERTEDDKLITLPGVTLMPGMIDSHVHITGNQELHGYARLVESDSSALLSGVKNSKEMLAAGITTIRNLGAGNFNDVALRDAINSGTIEGPRIYAAGSALGITGGHCDANLLPREYGVVADGVADGPWEVTTRVRENIKYGVDLIKFCATGGVMSKGTKVGVQQYTLEEMSAIVREAH